MRKITNMKWENYKPVIIESEAITPYYIADRMNCGYKFEVVIVKEGVVYFHEIAPKWY